MSAISLPMQSGQQQAKSSKDYPSLTSNFEKNNPYSCWIHPLWQGALYTPFLTEETRDGQKILKITNKVIKKEFSSTIWRYFGDKDGDIVDRITAEVGNPKPRHLDYDHLSGNSIFDPGPPTTEPCLSTPKLQKIRNDVAKTGVWEHYIVRKNEFASKYRYSSSKNETYHQDLDQIRYGALMHLATVISSKWMEENTDHALFDIITRVSSIRREISYIQQIENYINVGHPRSVDMITRLRKDYAQLIEPLNKQAKNNQLKLKLPVTDDTVTSEFVSENFEGFDENKKSVFNSILNHLGVNTSRRIMRDVAILYDRVKAKNYGSNIKELYKDLGRIFWWICRAKPWYWGDPSIAEIFVKSIALNKGHPIQHPWKENLIPWVEVIKNIYPEDFAEKFTQLFDKSITANPEAYNLSMMNNIYAGARKGLEYNVPNFFE